jgi:hypothetical protein
MAKGEVLGVCAICSKEIKSRWGAIQKDGLWVCAFHCANKYDKEKKAWSPEKWDELRRIQAEYDRPVQAGEASGGLTPEEKRRIYEEEKVRLEAKEDKKKLEEKNIRTGCLGLIVLIVVVVIAIVVGVAVCGGPTFDEQGINKVEAYAGDIIPAVDIALYDIAIPENLVNLQEDADNIRNINARHLTEDFPSYENIQEWGWQRTMGPNKWNVDGKELAHALSRMESSSNWLAGALELMVITEGNTDTSSLASGLYEAKNVMDELRWILYRK